MRDKLFKVVAHYHYEEKVRIDVIEIEIKNITKKNYILQVDAFNTKRVPIHEIHYVNENRAYIFDINDKEEAISRITDKRIANLLSQKKVLDRHIISLHNLEINEEVKKFS